MKSRAEIEPMREQAYANQQEAAGTSRQEREFAAGVEAGLLWALGDAGDPFADPYGRRTFPLADGEPGCGRYMARATGEVRPPKKGEWYLSGAVVEAYRARNDMTGGAFQIAARVEKDD